LELEISHTCLTRWAHLREIRRHNGEMHSGKDVSAAVARHKPRGGMGHQLTGPDELAIAMLKGFRSLESELRCYRLHCKCQHRICEAESALCMLLLCKRLFERGIQ
jgi:hypothetical protein